MKRLVSLILSAFAGSSCFAQWQWKEPDLHEDQIYDLSVGKMSMRIAAERGGRIISLKYDGTEVLSQLKMPNMYGSTFWTSPQSEWNWPPVREHDSALYDVVKTDWELMQDTDLKESVAFAKKVQNEMVGTAGRKNMGIRQADFAVLRLTYMPSVLLEIGYISNPAEEEYLLSSNGQKSIAKSIYNAIVSYKKSK